MIELHYLPKLNFLGVIKVEDVKKYYDDTIPSKM